MAGETGRVFVGVPGGEDGDLGYQVNCSGGCGKVWEAGGGFKDGTGGGESVERVTEFVDGLGGWEEERARGRERAGFKEVGDVGGGAEEVGVADVLGGGGGGGCEGGYAVGGGVEFCAGG